MTRTTSGTAIQGWRGIDEKFCNSRMRLPQDGNGSAIPNPNRARFTSLSRKAEAVVQTCAHATGARLGAIWVTANRHGPQPAARARNTYAARTSLLAAAIITRAGPGHPRSPRSENVTATDSEGAVFRGRTARTARSRNNHGTDRNRSMKAVAAVCCHGSESDAPNAIARASPTERRAAAGARRREILPPYKRRDSRSLPTASVPKR